jgi:hypothetical protein
MRCCHVDMAGKRDVFAEQGEAVVKETQVLQETMETHPPFAVMSTWQHRRNYLLLIM